MRLKNYDYAQTGAYFVTICSQNRECLFGNIIDGEMKLNECGEIAESCLKEIPEHFNCVGMDYMIVMPNHVHFILNINDDGDGKERRGIRRGVACYAPTNNTQNNNYYSKIAPKHNTLSTIIRSFKSAVTKQINQKRNVSGMPVWQRNYFERVIRDEKELFKIRYYIQNNPMEWDIDNENPKNIKT